MFKVLELSQLFVCLGELLRILVTGGPEEIAEFWFTRGDKCPGWHYASVSRWIKYQQQLEISLNLIYDISKKIIA